MLEDFLLFPELSQFYTERFIGNWFYLNGECSLVFCDRCTSDPSKYGFCASKSSQSFCIPCARICGMRSLPITISNWSGVSKCGSANSRLLRCCGFSLLILNVRSSIVNWCWTMAWTLIFWLISEATNVRVKSFEEFWTTQPRVWNFEPGPECSNGNFSFCKTFGERKVFFEPWSIKVSYVLYRRCYSFWERKSLVWLMFTDVNMLWKAGHCSKPT